MRIKIYQNICLGLICVLLGLVSYQLHIITQISINAPHRITKEMYKGKKSLPVLVNGGSIDCYIQE